MEHFTVLPKWRKRLEISSEVSSCRNCLIHVLNFLEFGVVNFGTPDLLDSPCYSNSAAVEGQKGWDGVDAGALSMGGEFKKVGLQQMVFQNFSCPILCQWEQCHISELIKQISKWTRPAFVKIPEFIMINIFDVLCKWEHTVVCIHVNFRAALECLSIKPTRSQNRMMTYTIEPEESEPWWDLWLLYCTRCGFLN